jgi:prephenate dehydratase
VIKAAFAGESGAFAELAAREYFGAAAELSGVPEFEDVFKAVKRRACDFGVIPIENSFAGSIHQNYDLLLESKLCIAAEIYMRVNHCLVGKKGTALGDVRRVFSHPQALAQCRRFLKHHPRVKLIPAANTALAARMVGEDGEKDTAAIASRRAAADHGLKIIAPDIEDSAENATRFLIISQKPTENKGLPRKTSIVFSVKNMPGALFKALGVFALRDIDLFKIESRPIRSKGFEYLFYLDCRGDITDTALKNAVSHLKEIATFYRMLGSYDIAPASTTSPMPLDISCKS